MMADWLTDFVRPMCPLSTASQLIPFCSRESSEGPKSHTANDRPIHWADYPRLIDLQTRTFDRLLDDGVGSKDLALGVKKAEVANDDLITLVKLSDLKSKDQIAERLRMFSDDAKRTGQSLHSLWAKTNGAIDSYVPLSFTTSQGCPSSAIPPGS